MHDLIIIRRLNKRKVLIVLLMIILLIVLLTIGGIKLAKQYQKNQYEKQLRAQEELERQIALEQKQKEEEEKQKAIQKRIEQTNREFTEEEKDRILHIYRSTGEKRVFLTFDDGPSQSVTPLILDVLKQENSLY